MSDVEVLRLQLGASKIKQPQEARAACHNYGFNRNAYGQPCERSFIGARCLAIALAVMREIADAGGTLNKKSRSRIIHNQIMRFMSDTDPISCASAYDQHGDFAENFDRRALSDSSGA